MKRIAFLGGSFDPVHNGHMTIARQLIRQFELDKFVFIPAFEAPHRVRKSPTSAFHRYAMLCLATSNDSNISVSKIEIESPEKPYTVQTLSSLKSELPDAEIFFVLGSDSWLDIVNWREWETVLSLTNHIVVTRPGYDVSFSHMPGKILSQIDDIRAGASISGTNSETPRIYMSNAVMLDISSSEIRRQIRERSDGWQKDVPDEVANYIRKYQIYK